MIKLWCKLRLALPSPAIDTDLELTPAGYSVYSLSQDQDHVQHPDSHILAIITVHMRL